MRELYSLACGRAGMSPAYFLDSASIDEVEAFLSGWEKECREDWERMRYIMYSIVQVNSKKRLSPEDVMKFGWDNEDDGDEKRATAADWEMARAEARRMKEILKQDKQ